MQKYIRDSDTFFYKSWWTDEGFVHKGTNRRTKEEVECLIPFSQMKEVLIGQAWIRLSFKSIDSAGKKRNLYREGLRFVFKVEQDDGFTYLLFLSETKKAFTEWMDRIRAHGIPAYVTELDLHDAELEDFEHHYDSIMMEPLREDNLEFPNKKNPINQEVTPPQWKPDSFYKRKKLKEARFLDRMKKIRLILFIGSFLVALLWIPHWPSDDSDNFIFFLFGTMILLFPTFMHNEWKPYQSLLDTLLIGSALFAGVLTANLYTPISGEHYLNTWATFATFALFHNVTFFMLRFKEKSDHRPSRKR